MTNPPKPGQTPNKPTATPTQKPGPTPAQPQKPAQTPPPAQKPTPKPKG